MAGKLCFHLRGVTAHMVQRVNDRRAGFFSDAGQIAYFLMTA